MYISKNVSIKFLVHTKNIMYVIGSESVNNLSI